MLSRASAESPVHEVAERRDQMRGTEYGFFGFLQAYGVAVAECAISADLSQALFPQEQASISVSVPKRRREFSTGRVLARRAMAALDIAPRPILRGSSREPMWPVDVAGSITHTDTWCCAVVAKRNSELSSIGIDLEVLEPLPADLIPLICCREAETAMLVDLPADQRGLAARCIFSAKESFYKAQFPLTRRLLQMHDVSVEEICQDAFRVRVLVDAEPFVSGQTFLGRLKCDRAHIATGMRL